MSAHKTFKKGPGNYEIALGGSFPIGTVVKDTSVYGNDRPWAWSIGSKRGPAKTKARAIEALLRAAVPLTQQHTED